MLERFGQWLAVDVLRFSVGSRLGETVSFFIADVVKILFLLVGLIFIIAVVRSFIPHARLRDWMARRGFLGYFFAALFGAVTPFCSCSSIPIFFAFLKAGTPLGVMFSFLVTSPIINEYVVVLMFGTFGWKITAAYVVSGMAIGIVSGMVLARMRLEEYLEKDFIFSGAPAEDMAAQHFPTFKSRMAFGWGEALSITRKVWLWVVVGVGVGALIHNYIPQDVINTVVSSTGFFAVPFAVLIGTPMYGSCAAIVPIAVALFQKGVPLGTSLAFMLAVSALSFPEAVMLRRAMKLPLILVFFGVTAGAIMITGYLFNILQHWLVG